MVAIDSISAGLRRRPDGIWYASERAPVSYPPEGSTRCLAVEEGSFWFHHRNECIVAAARTLPPPNGATILDVGGGNGFVSIALQKAGFDPVLVEPNPVGASNARRRGLETVVCGTLEGCRFRKASVPACGVFDVVEHIEDDVRFLRTLGELLTPAGRLYVTVPAYPFLWSDQDELAGHYRRYTVGTLRSVVARAGLEVTFATYFFRALPIPVFLARTLPFRLGFGANEISLAEVRRDHRLPRGILPSLDAEVRNIRRLASMRFGASCLVVATRPTGSSPDTDSRKNPAFTTW